MRKTSCIAKGSFTPGMYSGDSLWELYHGQGGLMGRPPPAYSYSSWNLSLCRLPIALLERLEKKGRCLKEQLLVTYSAPVLYQASRKHCRNRSGKQLTSQLEVSSFSSPLHALVRYRSFSDRRRVSLKSESFLLPMLCFRVSTPKLKDGLLIVL